MRARAPVPTRFPSHPPPAPQWWEAEPLPLGVKWRSMEHPGVSFAAPYVPHGVPLLYEGVRVALPPAAEEIASAYAVIGPDTPQLAAPKTARIFKKNVWESFAKTLPAGSPIKELEKCDFSVSGGGGRMSCRRPARPRESRAAAAPRSRRPPPCRRRYGTFCLWRAATRARR